MHQAWKANRALLPLHLIHTYAGRFPRESLLESCSGEDNGVRGLSACSAISAMSFLNSHSTSSLPPSAQSRTEKQKLQEALARKLWKDRCESREVGQRRSREKGEGAAGNNIRNCREEALSCCWG